jgi:acyl carrier protein
MGAKGGLKILLAGILMLLVLGAHPARAHQELTGTIDQLLDLDVRPVAIGHRGYGANLGEDPLRPIAELLKQPEARVTDAAILAELALDSFALVDMVIELQDSLGMRFEHEEFRGVSTVGDLLRLIEAKASMSAATPRAGLRWWLGISRRAGQGT